jgi:hypothetical protein
LTGGDNRRRRVQKALLHRFSERFGTGPLWNKQFERRHFRHYHYSPEKLDYVLGKSSDARYPGLEADALVAVLCQLYENTYHSPVGVGVRCPLISSPHIFYRTEYRMLRNLLIR